MFKKILIANRGEIAVRLIRAVHDMDIESVAIFAQDDAQALHVQLARRSVGLPASGPGAYLNIANIIEIALSENCDAIHPGYGFLSERAEFAEACAQAGLVFIGPQPQHLKLFGDKSRARQWALDCNVPVMPGLNEAVSLQQVQAFFELQKGAGVMIKAIGGGGGRGMRAVFQASDLPAAYARCASEARAFGVEGVYVERLMARARHIEIQVLGDGTAVVSLGDRECTLQRRFQKLIEIAPSPSFTPAIRTQITQAALHMAARCNYSSLGTFEFLVDAQATDLSWVFMEANPRLQVEHTVTEEVTGLDLVQLQIQMAAGMHLKAAGLDPQHPPLQKGYAIQVRIGAETLNAQGQTQPTSGTLTRFDMPSGPGIRVDTHGYTGASPSPHYDTLLAKLIVSSKWASFEQVTRKTIRALTECHWRGLKTNADLLQAILELPEFVDQAVHTRFIEENLSTLIARANTLAKPDSPRINTGAPQEPAPNSVALQAHQTTVASPMAAKLIQIEVQLGDLVPQGAPVAIIEAMKMEHVVLAPSAGRVSAIMASAGDFLAAQAVLMVLDLTEVQAPSAAQNHMQDLDAIRDDLKNVQARHAFLWDENRMAAVSKRHSQGGRTARENVAQLCDDGSFMEYGALAIAAQTRRRSLEDLMANTPADGMVTGIGTVNASLHGPEKSRCVVMAYDYMVLAGTQGAGNHQKTDRMLGLALQLKLPVVLFAEGGGGRPGDVDRPVVAGLNNHTFSQFAALSGWVPVVGIVHGRCFAGNAALLGCSDVIIATESSNIGRGGTASNEGDSPRTYAPEDSGTSDVQSRNGVIDLLVKDEIEAVDKAKQYLSYFQGKVTAWTCDDQRKLRFAVPENRLRIYDIRAVVQTLCDKDAVMELRQGFGLGMMTALARIEGRAVGIMANNPMHLGGAIDVEAADKASRFMQLCQAHGLPLISLTDTPGFMVGPEIEAQAQVRHTSRMFVVAAKLKVPFFAVVLRKGYGLGAQAMTAGGFDAPVFTIAWPTGEFGPMGLEGSVRLGFRKELEAQPEGPLRDALFNALVAERYAVGKAINMAQTLEIDAVIDPSETRTWIVRGLDASLALKGDHTHGFIDTW
jgi:acetyl/propionyl-CoA carboxylase alpha subunit/acetyl-CoA carboxylase carboxyltransferase component